MKRKIFFVIAGLAAMAMVSCTDDSTADPKLCGNGALDAGEACDGTLGVPATCADYDSTKTWKAGGMPACGVSETNDACKILVGTCVEEGAAAVCGNGLKEDDEVCDGTDGLPTTCAAFDSTKTWQVGGTPACGAKDSTDACKILVGTCVEEGAAATCGNGIKEGDEACDGGDGLPVTCAEFDSTKTWQADGAPACGVSETADACKILVGSCVEEGVTVICGDGQKQGLEVCDFGASQSKDCSELDAKYVSGQVRCEDSCGSINLSACVVKTFCGDGIVNNAEQCEPDVDSALTCADYDSTKTWQAGGAPACGAAETVNACKLTQGSCVEQGHTVVCGDDIQEGDEVCDYGKTGSKACKTINPKYVSGNAICESCKTVDVSGCVEDTVMGLKWCQLMPPTQVKFTNLVSEFTVNALVHVTGVTDKTPGLDNVNAPKAIFTFGEDPNKLDEWFHVAATGDPATNHPFADNYTAKLTKDDMLFLGSDVKQAYYSFGFAMHDSDDYKYCRRNMEDEAVEDLTLKLINDKVDANVHIMGSAKVQDIAVDKLICEFTFDGLTDITKDSVIPASTGTCTIQALPNLRCERNGCITSGIEQSWNVENYKKNLDDALAASHIILKASTTGASNIDLLLKMRRNNLNQSPSSVAVLYSLDGTTYVEAAILQLTTIEEEVKLLLDYKVQLPSAVNNQELLYIKLAPFGAGNNAMRFDDIQLSKR